MVRRVGRSLSSQVALKSIGLTACIVALSQLPSFGQATAADTEGQVQAPADVAFSHLVDSFFSDSFKMQPSWATAAGFHDHDNELEDYSPLALNKRLKMLESYQSKLQAIRSKTLTRDYQIDRILLLNHVKSSLLTLRDLEMWKKNPDYYSTSVSESIFGLVKRNFAPARDRLKSVVARELQIPRVLQEGEANLDPHIVPQVYAEIALIQLPDIVRFFADSVPAAFAQVEDPDLKRQLADSTAQAVKAIRKYQTFVGKNLLEAGCTGSFALGEDRYLKKLLYEEMIDEPIDRLLTRGEAELKRLQAQFEEVGKRIDPTRSVEDTYREIAKFHPKPDHLLEGVSDVLEQIRTYCIEHHIVTIPGDERPIVEETPAFMRALTFASIDNPGPFEKKAKESYYNVTLPDPKWSQEKIEEHMRTFSFPDLLNTSVHEAYPGHFVQYLWLKAAPTKTRKLIGCTSYEEGWAHYCEQMMLDEGFGSGDDKNRMVEIHDALLRACRYIVGIRMHTRHMTIQQGIRFFMKEGYQEEANADRETKRGTMDPTYLVYTLGKMQILQLREDYKKTKGDMYKLVNFHDEFLSVGYPPIKLVRAVLFDEKIPE